MGVRLTRSHSKAFRPAMFCLIEFCLKRNDGDVCHTKMHLPEARLESCWNIMVLAGGLPYAADAAVAATRSMPPRRPPRSMLPIHLPQTSLSADGWVAEDCVGTPLRPGSSPFQSASLRPRNTLQSLTRCFGARCVNS